MLHTSMNTNKKELLIILMVITIGLATAFYLYGLDKYSLLYYGDSTSHLVAARKIVEWTENQHQFEQPPVWLPLPHFLLTPFSLIDPLFTTGFAGTIVSLTCLALTSVFLYKIIRSLTGYSHIAFAGALLYASNPNILYLGITAMTEAPFMLFFVGGVYYFQKWYQTFGTSTKSYDLIKCSIFVVLATLCRYEAWFIPFVLMALTVIVILKKRVSIDITHKFYTILFTLVSFSGIAVWIIYNFMKYGDPLEFAHARFYSAAWQAANGPNRAILFMQPLHVTTVYGTTAEVIYGPILLIMTALGIIFHKRLKGNHEKKYLFIFLAIPPIFTIISLLIGIGEMTYWFNARFLILLSPLIIVASSLCADRIYRRIKKKAILFALITILFLYPIFSPTFGVPTFADAEIGFHYKLNPSSVQVGEKLSQMYDGGMIYVLTGSAQGERIMVTSGISLKNFDDITDLSTSKSSFKEPWLYDKWMIIGKVPGSDASDVAKYWLDNIEMLNEHYDLAYENDYYKILIRK